MNTFVALIGLCILVVVLYTYNKKKVRPPQVLSPARESYGPVRTGVPRRRSTTPGLSAPPSVSMRAGLSAGGSRM